MGYHVAILRTQGGQQKPIREDEIASVVGEQFGFRIERDASGAIKQISKDVAGESALLFYDGGELWAKTPGQATLGAMIDIASALGGGARVRGDEAESYRSVTETFHHPDDAQLLRETATINWPHVLSRAFPILAALTLIVGLGALLLRYLSKG